jgi:2-polyprenyl-6-methoxyphenol hydroxylase-like FAD-dependent oxidoreductase
MTVIDTPVLIVGGGPVGLTLGIDLAWRGQRCLLVEERTAPTRHPKATLLGARSMELYRRWGLEDAIYAAALPEEFAYYIIFTTRLAGQELFRFQSPSIRETRTRDPQALRRYRELSWSPYGKTQIGQQKLEPVLLDRARRETGLELRHGWRFERLTQYEDHVVAELVEVESGRRESVRAAYLVACDGGASEIRRALGVRMGGRGKMRANVSLYFRSRAFLESHALGIANLYFVFAPGSFGVFTAIDGRELWNFQYYFLDAARQEQPLDPERILADAMGKPFPFELLEVTHWHHHQSVAYRWRDRRVFLAGDAAHLFAPTGGVGMNTGIGDADDLAWKLDAVLRGWGGPRLLDSYEEERRPVAIRNSLISATNSDKIDFVMGETPSDIDRTDGAGGEARVGLSRRIRWLARQFNSAGTHLGYRYVDSPIVVADGSPEPPDDPHQLVPSSWPGSRAPHAWMADGRSVLDLLGRDFVLLCFGDARGCTAGLVEAARAVGIPLRIESIDEPEVARLYERRLVLVRPDGHVAWRGDEPPPDAVGLFNKLRGAGDGA